MDRTITLHAGMEGYNTFERGVNRHSYAGAAEAYLNTLGLDRVCCEVGRKVEDWDKIKAEWLSAFRAGWEEARFDHRDRLSLILNTGLI